MYDGLTPYELSTDPATLQKALAIQKDAYLHLAADFDNYQKRTRRDSEREAAAEKESFIRDLLPVLDNLERALVSENVVSQGLLYQGVKMAWQQWIEILHRHGIDAVEDLGRPFDPYQHEAVSVQHDPSQPHHTVLKVLLCGYRRGDKLFRPAKVIVNDLNYSPGGPHAG
jgi:molecular chaperone GrpE